MKISLIIKTKSWGDAQQGDVLKVLNSAQSILNAAFNRSFPGNILIYQNVSEKNPITLYEKSPCGSHIIKLSATDRYWSQYAYQFSHEYCHVRTNYSTINNRTKWFEETICELASIYALNQMSKAWTIKPPYPHWRSYSENFANYAEAIISDPKHKLPEGVNFEDWFKANLPTLEHDQYIRDSNTLIAIKLLPLFEKHPSLWNSMTYWNTWDNQEDANIYSCMQTWLSVLPSKNKECATALVEIFK